MPAYNAYSTEYKRRELQMMAEARSRMPPTPAQQHAAHELQRQQMYDSVALTMEGLLDGLDMVAADTPLTHEQALQWIDVILEWAPLIAQIPFGAGPVKVLPQLVLKGLNKASINGFTLPTVEKAVNNGVALSGLASVANTPYGWAQKIWQAAAAAGHTGTFLALPTGVKTALAPSLGNLLVQISNWTATTAGTFGYVAKCIAGAGPAFSAWMAIMNVALSYSKFDGMQAILDHHGNYQCSCRQHAEQVVERSMEAIGDRALGLHPVFAVGVAAKAIDTKAHWLANKFRGPENRTHRSGHAIAVALWEGAQAPSRHTGYKTPQPLVASGRCRVAMLTMATLFGNGDPVKGYKAAVAAIQADMATGPNRLKPKIG